MKFSSNSNYFITFGHFGVKNCFFLLHLNIRVRWKLFVNVLSLFKDPKYLFDNQIGPEKVQAHVYKNWYREKNQDKKVRFGNIFLNEECVVGERESVEYAAVKLEKHSTHDKGREETQWIDVLNNTSDAVLKHQPACCNKMGRYFHKKEHTS